MDNNDVDAGVNIFPDALTGQSLAYRLKACSFNRKTLTAASFIAEMVEEQQPMTVRSALYRAVHAGIYPDTSKRHYRQCQRIILKLRRRNILSFDWIVDSTRRRLKPSSWSGLGDYAESVAACYRRDLWARQNDYVEVFVEKDAMTGFIEPVTNEFDVHLNPIRGDVSETFVYNIAAEWRRIQKPIHVYYLGDHDPSGLEIEQTTRIKLEKFSGRTISWIRIAITPAQLQRQNILGFPVKPTISAAQRRSYIARFGNRCVEVDALEPNEVRQLVRSAIESHIDKVEWQRLQEIERLEKETIRKLALALKPNGSHDDQVV